MGAKNKLPKDKIDIVYVFSGVEKHRLIGSSKDRLETGVKVWKKLAEKQSSPPIFLFQGSNDWLIPVKKAFEKKLFNVTEQFLRLELIKSWKNTLDQFLQIPNDLKSKKNWLIVTSPWHLPRVRRYKDKHWSDKKVFYWTSPYRKSEFDRYQKAEIAKIIRYAQTHDL